MASNLQRVEGLVALFDESSSPARMDVLRACVVLLHATLEDVFRSALEVRLPHADSEHLAMLRFEVRVKDPSDPTKHRPSMKDKISMSELAKHREKTVEQLIGERIEAYLENSNFNNVEDLVDALKRVGLPTTLLDPHQANLTALMQRRHWIVHRADQKRDTGTLRETVQDWKEAVTKVCGEIVAKMDAP